MAADPRPPLSVRWIWVVRDGVGRQWRRGLIAIAVLLVAVSFARGFYAIDNGKSGALLRFGALVDDAVPPGLHYRLPAGIDRVIERRTGEVVRLEILGDWSPQLSLVSGDENLIDVGATAQYRILRLGNYLFSSNDVESVMRQTLRAELLEAAAGLGVDDLLTSAKAGVQQQVQLRSQERFDDYGLGVALVSVSLRTVDPPEEAEQAFRAVLDARADAARGVSLARSRADRRIGLARGRAAQRVAEAEAAAARRLQEAQAAARRFDDLLTQQLRSPDLVRDDLYLRSVRRALAPARVIVLPPGAVDRLDLVLTDPLSSEARDGSPHADSPF
ncbi:MAG: protease modulator HflK [Acidobacteriota bacterium]